eukprot:g60516.t1
MLHDRTLVCMYSVQALLYTLWASWCQRHPSTGLFSTAAPEQGHPSPEKLYQNAENATRNQKLYQNAENSHPISETVEQG